MDSELAKKQTRKMTIFACLLSVLSIGLLIFGFSVVSSDKVVMLQSISNLSKKVGTIFQEDEGLLDKLSSSTDIGLKSDIKFSTEEESVGITFDYLENKKEETSSFTFDSSINEESFLGFDVVLKDSNLYAYIDDITPSYYYTAVEYFSILSGLSSGDSDKFFAILKDVVNDYIENSAIKKDKTTISYQGKDKKVNRLTYQITNQTIYDVVSRFITELKKDKTLWNHISTYLGFTEEELNEKANTLLESLDQNDTILYYYKVYYYGFNHIVYYELEEVATNTTLAYKVEDKEKISIIESGTTIVSVSIEKDKNIYKYSGFIVDGEQNNYPFSGTFDGEQFTFIFDTSEGSVQLDMVITSNSSNERYIYQIDASLSMTVEETTTNLFDVDLVLEYYFNQKVDVKLENSKDIMEMTEEELTIIQNNLLNHPLYTIISSFSAFADFSL